MVGVGPAKRYEAITAGLPVPAATSEGADGRPRSQRDRPHGANEGGLHPRRAAQAGEVMSKDGLRHVDGWREKLVGCEGLEPSTY